MCIIPSLATALDSEMEECALDEEEKALLREEFTSRMYQRFLDGKDRDFNYRYQVEVSR